MVLAISSLSRGSLSDKLRWQVPPVAPMLTNTRQILSVPFLVLQGSSRCTTRMATEWFTGRRSAMSYWQRIVSEVNTTVRDLTSGDIYRCESGGISAGKQKLFHLQKVYDSFTSSCIISTCLLLSKHSPTQAPQSSHSFLFIFSLLIKTWHYYWRAEILTFLGASHLPTFVEDARGPIIESATLGLVLSGRWSRLDQKEKEKKKHGIKNTRNSLGRFLIHFSC